MLLEVFLQCSHVHIDTIMANGARMNCNDMDVEFRLGRTNLVADVAQESAATFRGCVGLCTRLRGNPERTRLWARLRRSGVD